LEVLEQAEVERIDDRELVVMTHTAAVVGEELTVRLASQAKTEWIRGRVIETRLVVVNRDVRHRVRVARLDVKPAPKETVPHDWE
jgi:hypothetical protein